MPDVALPPAHAHHFASLEEQRESASLGMWVFLVTEVLFFGGLFAAYAVYRNIYAPAFEAASKHLDVPLGATNTAVLIASSLTMALAVHASAHGRKRALVGFLLATIALGQTVGLSCDSCKDGLQARISFISNEAEFTPPVIFSEQERAKLVFRVEARPLDGADLPIGLPVTVTPAEPEPRS